MRRFTASLLALIAGSMLPGRGPLRAQDLENGGAPPPAERQLPRAMHSAMQDRPVIRVGREGADLNGSDHRVLQAAVDYLAGLGGGTVEIGPGEFTMGDSLHLRSHVTVRGVPGKTVLRKTRSALSPLAIDGDFGEEQVTLRALEGFEVGMGIAVWDDHAGGFHTTVGRITGRTGNRLSISQPLMADCMVAQNARAATVFPVVSGRDIEDARVEGLTIDGNREENVPLNGCRGAGIYLYRGHGTVISGCTVRAYNGDGISFQQSNDVTVEKCVSEGNADLGLHPGSGSQRPIVRGCIARKNGTDGLFLCWRVRHGLFEDNVLEGNHRFGVSIGHKDSDNLLRKNVVRGNDSSGFCFRDEAAGMAAHRNRLEENLIEDNGGQGIRIQGETRGLVFKGNRIHDSRPADSRSQKTAILIEEKVGDLSLEENQVEGPIEDRRSGK